jgi:WD40 repeat protein
MTELDEDRTQWMNESGNAPDSDKTMVSNESESVDMAKTEKISLEGSMSLDWKPGDVVLDLYEVKEVFTTGGMGLVYHVHHRNWDIDLIIKSPRPEVIAQAGGTESFAIEAETWVDLGLHPNIVTCHYVRTIGGIPMVFAEYVDGGSLKDLIARGDLYKDGPVAGLERILDISIQFAWGLHYAHQKGLVHRDVKPANVLMTKGGSVKVTDFGLAKARYPETGPSNPGSGADSDSASNSAYADPDANSGQKTKALMTPAYCSPEQAERAALAAQEFPTSKLPELTSATDVWSFALSVMEMFIGGMTWTTGLAGPMVLEDYLNSCSPEENVEESKLEGAQEPLHENLPHMPVEMAALLKKCLNPNPDKRLSDMKKLIGELRKIYLQITGNRYKKKLYEPSELRADSLNNKALSMLDLGYVSKAEQLLEQALLRDPTNKDVNFNLNILKWRMGKIDDLEVLAMFEWQRELADDTEFWDDMIGKVQMERGVLSNYTQTLPNMLEQDALFDQQKNFVTSIDFSTDGQWVVSGSENNRNNKTLMIWDTHTCQLIREYIHHSYVLSTVFHPSGKYVLAGYFDGVMRRWSIHGGRPQSEFVHPAEQLEDLKYVYAISCCQDGNAVVAAVGANLYLWDLQTEGLLRTFSGHPSQILDVAFSPDGQTIASCIGAPEGAAAIIIWNIETGERMLELERSSHINKVAFSTDGNKLLAAGQHGLKLWDIKTGELLRTYQEDGINKTRLARFSKSSDLILETEWGQNTKPMLRIFDTARGQCRQTISLTTHQRGLALSPDGRTLALAENPDKSGEQGIRLWRFNEKSYIDTPYRLSMPQTSEEAVGFGRQYAAKLKIAKSDISLGIFAYAVEDLRSARAVPGYEMDEEALALWTSLYTRCFRTNLRSVQNPVTMELFGIGTFSPDSKSIGIHESGLFGSGQIRLRTLGEETNTHQLFAHKAGVNELRFHPYGKGILTASEDKSLILWSGDWKTKIREFIGHKEGVLSSAFSSDGRQILSGGADNMAILWDTETAKKIMTLKGHEEGICAVAINPNGWLLATASNQNKGKDYSIRLWDAKTGNCRLRIPFQWGITSLCFSINGRYLLAGCCDSFAYLYDAMTGALLRTLKGHTERVLTVAIDTNQKIAATGSLDKTVRIWDLQDNKSLFVIEKHQGGVDNVEFSNDCRYLLSSSHYGNGEAILLELDWDLKGSTASNWNENARRFLDLFIERHTPAPEGLFQKKPQKPTWTEEDFQFLMDTLGRAGFGYLKPEGVRKKLMEMTS